MVDVKEVGDQGYLRNNGQITEFGQVSKSFQSTWNWTNPFLEIRSLEEFMNKDISCYKKIDNFSKQKLFKKTMAC